MAGRLDGKAVLAFGDDLRAEFDELQQLWLNYRERRCLWERAYFRIGSGTMRRKMYFSCMRAMTVIWISDLKACAAWAAKIAGGGVVSVRVSNSQ